MPLYIKVILAIAVVGLSALAYYSQRLAPAPNNPSAPQAPADGDADEVTKRPAVADFTLTDAEGKQQKLSDFRGNVVILSFWASWCTPCLLELPTFAEIEKRYHDRGLRVLAVNVDEGDQGKTFAHDFWAKEKFTFPSFFDSTKQLEQQFEVDMLPSNFVIDREGRQAFSGFGANDWSNPQTKDFIESLLSEKAGDVKPAQEKADAAEAETH